MSESSDGLERWANEGGHGAGGPARADMLDQIAHADAAELAVLWPQVVRVWGDEASRLWQEALASSDASET